MESVQLAVPARRAPARRRARGVHPKSPETRQNPRGKRLATLPEYLDQHEIEQMLKLAPHDDARLLMLIQWRAGLRISEALELERRDVQTDTDRPTLKVRLGKGNRPRLVPVHPELAAALRTSLNYRHRRKRSQNAKVVGVRRAAASAWIQETVERAVQTGVLAPGRRVSSHTLRHSYARHLLANGVPLNLLSKWLGHRQLETTLIYLELVPDPAGTLAGIP